MNYINILLQKSTILIVKWLIQTIRIFVCFTIQTIQALNIIFISALVTNTKRHWNKLFLSSLCAPEWRHKLLWFLWYFTIARYTLASVFSCEVPYIWQLIPRDDRLRVGVVTGVEIKWLLDSWHSF